MTNTVLNELAPEKGFPFLKGTFLIVVVTFGAPLETSVVFRPPFSMFL